MWADGTSSYQPAKLIEQIATNKIKGKYFVTEIDKYVHQYNAIVDKDQQLAVKQDLDDLTFIWNIPFEYADVSVKQHIDELFIQQCADQKPKWSEQEMRARFKRVKKELELYHKLGFLDVLRAIIFIINTLSSKGIVWGVGRGSSVSSYVLYLIGAHDVDSFKYDLDINDFLQSNNDQEI